MQAADRKYAFLSYSHRDEEFAKRLARDLRAHGVDLWVDAAGIRAGARWEQEIQSALRGAHVVLCILSDTSVKSEHVLNELSFALDIGTNVIPLLISDVEVPLRIHSLQRIDFKDYPSGLMALRRRLASSVMRWSEEMQIWAGSPPAATACCDACSAPRPARGNFCPECGRPYAPVSPATVSPSAPSAPSTAAPRSVPPQRDAPVRRAADVRPSPHGAQLLATLPGIKSLGVAVLLSLLLPGAGHVYLGQSTKGVALLIAAFVGAALTGGLLWIALGVWCAIDAHRMASQAAIAILKPHR